MILYIDTANFDKITFALADKKIIKRVYNIDSQKSNDILTKFGDFIKLSKVKLAVVKKIVVNKGPGSYTGVRVGISHAQALGLALNVPVKALSAESFKIGISSK